MDGAIAAEEAESGGGGEGDLGGDGIVGAVTGVGSAGPCFDGAAGAIGEIGGPTFVVMATATVIGVAACAVPVSGAVDDTSTNRAVLWRLASFGGGAWGGDLSP